MKTMTAVVTMNGTSIGTIKSNTRPGNSPWGISHTTNAIIDLCTGIGVNVTGKAFRVTLRSGKTWEWTPRA
jgi:hypothetical protein